MTTVANPQASEQSAPQPDQGTEEGIRRAAEIYRNAGIRWDNELLSAIAANSRLLPPSGTPSGRSNRKGEHDDDAQRTRGSPTSRERTPPSTPSALQRRHTAPTVT